MHTLFVSDYHSFLGPLYDIRWTCIVAILAVTGVFLSLAGLKRTSALIVIAGGTLAIIAATVIGAAVSTRPGADQVRDEITAYRATSGMDMDCQGSARGGVSAQGSALCSGDSLDIPVIGVDKNTNQRRVVELSMHMDIVAPLAFVWVVQAHETDV